MQAEEQSKSRGRSALREFTETILFTLLLYFLVRTFLIENYRVVGRSMEPTLQDNQYLVVYKLGYHFHEPQRGDIVVFGHPGPSDEKLIKRVIGVPGDQLEVRGGRVFIDDQPLEEPYIRATGRYSLPPTTIPDDQYYVLGDNRLNSSDSHDWGMLPRDEIVGNAWFTYWPVELWGLVPHSAYKGLP